MATAFSEKEKELIRAKLRDAAKECLSKYGVKKTTVDQLVQMTGISKGAFYSFYPSKELLFFNVLEEQQGYIMKDVIGKLEAKESIYAQEFSDVLFEVYQNVRKSFMMTIIQLQEYEYLFRKLPMELIENHHSFDDILAQKMFLQLKLKQDVDLSVVTAAFRAVFLSMLHVKEIGEKDYDKVLKLLIKGLTQQFVEEESLNE